MRKSGTKNRISIEKAVLADVCLGLPLGKLYFGIPAHIDINEVQDENPPNTYLFRGEQLALMKRLYKKGEETIVEAVEELKKLADEVSKEGPFSVADKSRTIFGGNVHDYQSLAKYAWPSTDDDQDAGYVIRDGEVNPWCYSEEFDYVRLVKFSENVVLLSIVAYLTECDNYAEVAASLCKTWFLDPNTRQTPHFSLAQSIPGSDKLRWQGVIEARFFIYVTEAIRVLEAVKSSGLDARERTELRSWFSDMLDWMQTSRQGIAAQEARNNIGFWYDLQRMVYADFCGRPELCEQIVVESVLPRLEEGMDVDGGLLQELARAYPQDYVAFSMVAMALISRAGEKSGMALWGSEDGDGRNFQVAHDWLAKSSGAGRLLAGMPLKNPLDIDPWDNVGQILDLGIKLRSAQHAARMATRKSTAIESEYEQLESEYSRLASEKEQWIEESKKLDLKYRELASRHGEIGVSYTQIETECSHIGTGLAKLEPELVRLKLECNNLKSEYERVSAECARLEKENRGYKKSRSWLITRPLRVAKKRFLYFAGLVDVMTIRVKLKRLSWKVRAWIVPHLPPKLKSWIKKTLATASLRFSGIKNAKETLLSTHHSKDTLEMLMTHKVINEERLKSEYDDGELAGVSDTFVLYRVIGNDLIPRHKKGQSRENLRFALEHEKPLENCEKIWVVNRIFDESEEQKIIGMLDEYQQSYIRIPFDRDDYRKIGWDLDALPGPEFLVDKRFDNIGEEKCDRLKTALYRLKNNYVMHNNGARNIALRDGVKRAKWILPWDGNCFLTPSAWRDITHAIGSRPHLKYFAVPMDRITDNEDLMRDDYTPNPVEEPQLIFRCDAVETFNENYPYGRRPKVELFWRLGIPGAWDSWKDDPWDQPRREKSPDYGQFGVAGWVARMYSGVKALETEDKQAFRNRGLARQAAIISAIDHIDRKVFSLGSNSLGLIFYQAQALDEARNALFSANETPLKTLAERIVKDAEKALNSAPYSVIQKTTLPPSGEIRDYWHPAPYWWPNPNSSDGLPYIRIDGQRVPGTKMYEPESTKYDRTRLQLMFDSTTALALGWYLSGREDFARHGANLVNAWFLDPETGMHPHLRYAQVRMGHNDNEGAATGIIEFKDFYYFLDAVRLLECSGALSKEKSEQLKSWLREYLEWLETSTQGSKELLAGNNHGTYFDLQVGAISAYLGDQGCFRDTMLRAMSRISKQFTESGEQPEEMTRAITQHYCFFNLQGWLNILILARAQSFSFGRFDEAPLKRIARAYEWVMQQDQARWPYEQIEPFDTDRQYPLFLAACRLGMDYEKEHVEKLLSINPAFDPHDAINPYWNVMAGLVSKENALQFCDGTR